MEEWLDSIKRARATKAKIRNLMSALFHHAMRYEWVDRNPIKLVRQSAKRMTVPDVLELAELQLLLSSSMSASAHWLSWMLRQVFERANCWLSVGRMLILRIWNFV